MNMEVSVVLSITIIAAVSLFGTSLVTASYKAIAATTPAVATIVNSCPLGTIPEVQQPVLYQQADYR
jgi:hypothetical protein